jgi:mono/diheme cytochrome c family protein
MRSLFRFRPLSTCPTSRRSARRSVWLSLSGACLGLILIALNPIGSPHSIDPQAMHAAGATLTPTPSTQAGHGQDVFWLNCMPCHGDKGQGLTDEFRTRQYPTEDQNCWKSGCHGERPYDNGFTLPKTIPALIGVDTLSRFNTAQNLYGFISTAMPFNKPGSLSQTEYLQVIAYLLSSNQIVAPDAQIDAASLAGITIRRPAADVTPAPNSASSTSAELPPAFWGIIIFLIVATVLSLVTRRRRF